MLMRRWPPRSSRSRTTVGYRAKRAVKRSASPQPVALSVPSPAVRAMICTVQPPNMRALPPPLPPAPATSLPLLQLHELLRLFPLWVLLAKRPLLCPWPSPLPMSLCAVVVRLLVARAAMAVTAVSVMERTVVVMGGSGIRVGGSGSSIASAPVVSSPALRRSARRLHAGASGAAVPGVRASGRGAAAASPPPAAAPPRLPLALALVRVALGSAARAQMPYLASRAAHPGVSAGAPPPVGSVAALPPQLKGLFPSPASHWPAHPICDVDLPGPGQACGEPTL